MTALGLITLVCIVWAVVLTVIVHAFYQALDDLRHDVYLLQRDAESRARDLY